MIPQKWCSLITDNVCNMLVLLCFTLSQQGSWQEGILVAQTLKPELEGVTKASLCLPTLTLPGRLPLSGKTQRVVQQVRPGENYAQSSSTIAAGITRLSCKQTDSRHQHQLKEQIQVRARLL